ncbi:hypothetical protein GCM10018954_005180 [Kutzneria kofuensis]
MSAAGCVFGFVLAYVVFVVSPTGRRLEDATLPRRATAARSAAYSPQLIALGIVVVLATGAMQRRWRQTAAAAVLLAGTISLAQLLKVSLLFRRARRQQLPRRPRHGVRRDRAGAAAGAAGGRAAGAAGARRRAHVLCRGHHHRTGLAPAQ